MGCGTLDPLLNFVEVDGGHFNMVSMEGNHISLKFKVSRLGLGKEDVSDGEGGDDADKVSNQTTGDSVSSVFDTYATKVNG